MEQLSHFSAGVSYPLPCGKPVDKGGGYPQCPYNVIHRSVHMFVHRSNICSVVDILWITSKSCGYRPRKRHEPVDNPVNICLLRVLAPSGTKVRGIRICPERPLFGRLPAWG